MRLAPALWLSHAPRHPGALPCRASFWPLEWERLDPPQVSVQKQGRFEVYEGDAGPVSPPQANGAALMEKHLAKPGTPDPNRCICGCQRLIG